MSYPKSVTFTQARNLIAETAQSNSLKTTQVSLTKAAGLLLMSDVTAATDVPAWDCSRVDGYAFEMAALNQNIDQGLPVAEAIHAGEAPTEMVDVNFAYPVMTGAKIPPGLDTVVMKEQATVTSDSCFKPNQKVEKGSCIRRKAEDVKCEQVILKKGRRLRSEDLGLMASVGVDQVMVSGRPKALLLLTGDELVTPGSDCKPGQIYDANSFMLRDLMMQMGCEVMGIKKIKDQEADIEQVMKTLKNKAIDLVVSVGGVSMGEKDYIPQVLDKQGDIVFHKTGVKPGFPLLFGTLGQALYFGLPGNPVSAYTTMCQFVWYAVRQMQGETDVNNLNWRGKLTHDVNKSHFRREFMRGYFVQNYDGSIDVTVCGGQQSSRIKSLVEANCFIVLDESQQDVKTGELVRIQPFHQFNNRS